MAEIRVEISNPPPCSRCGEKLLTAMNTPPGIDGPPVELCRWCHEGSEGTAGRLVAVILAGLDHESIQQAGALMTAWYEEEMAKRGWRHIPAPRSSPN